MKHAPSGPCATLSPKSLVHNVVAIIFRNKALNLNSIDQNASQELPLFHRWWPGKDYSIIDLCIISRNRTRRMDRSLFDIINKRDVITRMPIQ